MKSKKPFLELKVGEVFTKEKSDKLMEYLRYFQSQTKSETQPLKDWGIEFDILAINLGMDGEQRDEIRDFIRQLLSQTKSQIVEQILGMESIKDEQITEDNDDYGYKFGRNQLRLQIKEELRKL